MGRLLKFWSLSRQEKQFFYEAGALLVLSNLCVKTIPFRYVEYFLQAFCNNGARSDRQGIDVNRIDLVKLSLSRAANLLPWKSLCLSRSIAAFIMLHRRDIPVVMVAGVKVIENSSLLAHAWIQTDFGEPERNTTHSEFIPLLRIGQRLPTESRVQPHLKSLAAFVPEQ